MLIGHEPARGSAPGDYELEDAWYICADLFCAATASPPVTCGASFETELVFCLLSGFGVSYEHALSASDRVRMLAPFDRSWDAVELELQLCHELEQPQFEPRRRDGTPRRYRFPRRKAELIVAARQWLLSCDDVIGQLSSIESEHDRRRLLCGCPGVGPKTASWLLRNLGLASELAILDVHLLRALQASGRVDKLTMPRDYDLAEAAFLDWCLELGAPAAAFDLFVWEWQRGSLVKQ